MEKWLCLSPSGGGCISKIRVIHEKVKELKWPLVPGVGAVRCTQQRAWPETPEALMLLYDCEKRDIQAPLIKTLELLSNRIFRLLLNFSKPKISNLLIEGPIFYLLLEVVI